MPRDFLKTQYGLITETHDKRIMYFLPWNDVVIAGTTEDSLENPVIHPCPTNNKIAEIVENLKETFSGEEPKILSQWAGIRPLLRDPSQNSSSKIS